jgi:hypothetical protein
MPDILITHEDQSNLEHIILKEHVMTKIMLFQFSCDNLKNTNADIIDTLLKYVNYLFDVVIKHRMDNGTPSPDISLNLDVDIDIRRAEAVRVKMRTADVVSDIGRWIERRLDSTKTSAAEEKIAALESIQTLLVAAYAYVIRSGIEAWTYSISNQMIAHQEYSDYRTLKLYQECTPTIPI